MGIFSDAQGQLTLLSVVGRSRAANSIVSGGIWPKFKLMQALMYVIVTCKYKKDPIKNSRENVMTPFSPL